MPNWHWYSQGYKVHLELWKSIEEDARWLTQQGDFAPTKFNPDRYAWLLLWCIMLCCAMLCCVLQGRCAFHTIMLTQM